MCIYVYMKCKVIKLWSLNQTRKSWCRTTSSRSLLSNSRSQSPLSLKYSCMRGGGSIEVAFRTKDSRLARLSNFSAQDGSRGGCTLRRLLALGLGILVFISFRVQGLGYIMGFNLSTRSSGSDTTTSLRLLVCTAGM